MSFVHLAPHCQQATRAMVGHIWIHPLWLLGVSIYQDNSLIRRQVRCTPGQWDHHQCFHLSTALLYILPVGWKELYYMRRDPRIVRSDSTTITPCHPRKSVVSLRRQSHLRYSLRSSLEASAKSVE